MRPIRGTRNIPNFQFPTFVLQRNHAEFRSGIALRKITDDFWSVRLDRWLRYIVVEKKKKKREEPIEPSVNISLSMYAATRKRVSAKYLIVRER